MATGAKRRSITRPRSPERTSMTRPRSPVFAPRSPARDVIGRYRKLSAEDATSYNTVTVAYKKTGISPVLLTESGVFLASESRHHVPCPEQEKRIAFDGEAVQLEPEPRTARYLERYRGSSTRLGQSLN